MKKISSIALFSLITIFCLINISYAVETDIVVRAKSKDAKFIGTSMGGALVYIKDAETGEILVKGFTNGGTGDTNLIMKEPHKRGVKLSDESTAKFETTIDINEPKLVTVEMHAPYAQKQSMIKTSTQIWLIPGKHITGDGIVLEFPGFAVDVMTPQTGEKINLADEKVIVPIKANVVMMCGCPIKPEGIWDANLFKVSAILKQNGEVTETIPLDYANKTNTFESEIDITDKGTYELIVYAFDPKTGNSGVDKSSFTIVSE